MPKTIEIAFYQFGVRLTQCRELHHRCTEKSVSEPSGVFAGADCVVLLRRLLCALDSAFKQLAQITKLDVTRVEMGHALIGEFVQLWHDWSQLSTTQLHAEDLDDTAFHENAERIEAFVEQLLKLQPASGTKCEQWYELGKEFGSRYRDALCRHPRPTGSESVSCQEQSPAETRLPKWIRELLNEVEIEEKDLLPLIENKCEIADKVPFDPLDDEIWSRIEWGLAALKKPHAEAFELATSGSESSTFPTPTPAGDNTAGSHRLRKGYQDLLFDDDRYTVTRKGHEDKVLDLANSRLDRAIVDHLSEREDSWTHREAIAALWGEHGVARRPAQGTVDDKISDLSRKLGCLGLRIVSRRLTGLRLEALPPSEQDSPESCTE